MIRAACLFLTCVSFFAQTSVFAQTPGTIQTIAGNGSAGYSGDDGSALQASMSVPVDLSFDRAGNLFIADQFNNRIRKIAPNGIITTVAGTGTQGYLGDGGPATSAQLNTPIGIFADASGNLYIADTANQRIRKVDSSGIITTLAGNGAKTYGGDGGPAVNASFYNPVRVIADPSGNVLVADQSNHRIRRITPAGIITTLAGNGIGTPAAGAFSGDGGPAVAASLNNPTALTMDAAGVVYFSDQFNHRIRRITVDGTINTVAGNGSPGFTGDGGPALSASLNYPGGITVDSGGNLYVNDDNNFRTRRIANGIITTVAGNGSPGFSGDGGPATSAALNGNFGVQIDNAGNIYIADSMNNRIRKISPAAVVFVCTNTVTPVITSVNSLTDFGTFSTFAAGSWIEIKGTNLADAADPRAGPKGPGIWTTADFNGNNAPTSLDGVSVGINRKPAYVYYISPGQVDVQAPADSTNGPVPITVTNCKSTSTPKLITKANLVPGMLAPASFNIGKQYMVALLPDGFTYVGNANLIPGVPFRPAKPGEVINAFGIGFGDVTPAVSPGVTVTAANQLTNPLSITFGSTPASSTYYGLYPGYIGLYLFYITVPNVADGDYQINISVGGVSVPQRLFLTVHQ